MPRKTIEAFLGLCPACGGRGSPTPLAPSVNHGWLVDQETDKGAWHPLAEVRTWERV